MQAVQHKQEAAAAVLHTMRQQKQSNIIVSKPNWERTAANNSISIQQ
jgi:hypothetical protein